MNSPKNIIEIKDLTVRLGHYEALTGITVSIPAGAYVMVTGPNGGGKTTLLKCMLGLIKAHSGSLRITGVLPERINPLHTGYVPQFKTLDRRFPARAIELVSTGIMRRWPGRLNPDQRNQAMNALEKVGAERLAFRNVGELSGGELQRVYLARAMVRQPKLILLDEAATGMDFSGETDMYEILEDWRDKTGSTIIMVSHDWQGEHYHASHVLLLNRELISFGHPHESLSEENLGRAFGHSKHMHDHVHASTHSHEHLNNPTGPEKKLAVEGDDPT
jgi:zinc transport system ATP-binding protein